MDRILPLQYTYIRLVVRKLERRPRHSKKLNVVFQPKIFSFSFLAGYQPGKRYNKIIFLKTIMHKGKLQNLVAILSILDCCLEIWPLTEISSETAQRWFNLTPSLETSFDSQKYYLPFQPPPFAISQHLATPQSI